MVTSGPYRYVRHPMYTGGIIACLGSATNTSQSSCTLWSNYIGKESCLTVLSDGEILMESLRKHPFTTFSAQST